jgi:hypothetical protein
MKPRFKRSLASGMWACLAEGGWWVWGVTPKEAHQNAVRIGRILPSRLTLTSEALPQTDKRRPSM